jgi:hypothetical protein
MTRPRMLAMSSTGRFVAFRQCGGIEVVDELGVTPRRTFELAATGDFAICGAWLCLLDGSLRIERLAGTVASAQLALTGTSLRPFVGRTASSLLVDNTLVTLEPELARVSTNDGDAPWFPFQGRTMLSARGGELVRIAQGKNVPLATSLGEIRDAFPLFGGKSIAVLSHDAGGDVALVLQPSGRLVQRIRLPASTWHVFAPERGQLFLGSGDTDVCRVDLRYGYITHGTAPHAVTELATDDDAKQIAIAGPSQGDIPCISLLRADELFRDAPAPVTIVPELPSLAEIEPDGDEAEVDAAELDEPATEECAPEGESAEPEAVRGSDTLPGVLPLALGKPRRSPPRVDAEIDALPYADAREHLGALLDAVAARASLAIAEAWHSGRISAPSPDHLPFEREVAALSGATCGLAAERMSEAQARLKELARTIGERAAATHAAGIELPFMALARDLALSPIAIQILAIVLAPRLRPQIARLYRILGNEPHRPACDDAIVGYLFATDAHVHDVLVEHLAPESELFESGLVVRDEHGGLDVDPALGALLLGRGSGSSGAAHRRTADRSLDDLVIDRAILRRIIVELGESRARPLRLVVRGRRGAGRHTLIAALAARIEHAIVCIDASQLPREGAAEALRRELAHARLTRAVPVVSGLGQQVGDDSAQAIRRVVQKHRGPIVFRAGLDGSLPVDAGFLEIVLPGLTETVRQQTFRDVFTARGIVANTDSLARRYRIGPGTIHRIAIETRAQLDRSGGDATSIADEQARQYVQSRISATAQRVTRLAEWEDVALPVEITDSLRELVGRAQYSRTVYDTWGYDAKITTARGLTALFYGPPGTGKTMVAGLIARELGLDLYRVDLSKVMSKWVGETEKNLGEVFDAAEEGQFMLLFDEADSLFAKRSEVKSSNDRYANLEVNYLLQRLDTFEGLAILTTNLEGSIDPAFKRRLSMRLYFPFPDEELRAQLWEAHVLPGVPTAGKLDYAALARRFPLSGGYIRNSALRAAFLAAQERVPVTQAHLERAVLLEYRDMGKLAQDGRME